MILSYYQTTKFSPTKTRIDQPERESRSRFSRRLRIRVFGNPDGLVGINQRK